MKKKEQLYKTMLNSIYPFQFNTDTGKDLQESYNLIFNSYLIVKKNQDIFQPILGWSTHEYINFLNNNLFLCDLIYMLTHVYLKYPKETELFHIILSEIESLYFTLFNEEELIIKNEQLVKYYNQIKKIVKIYLNLKHVYNEETDKLLILDDILKRKYDLEKEEICKLYLEGKERREQD